MAPSSVPPPDVKIVLRSQQWDVQDLDVATAFSKHPLEVRNVLLEAIRQVDLKESDIRLLLVERAFESALKTTMIMSGEYRMSELILSCSWDDKPTASLFYEYGKKYGLAMLLLGTTANAKLWRKIERLQRQNQILLVSRLTNNPPEPKILKVMEDGTISEEAIRRVVDGRVSYQLYPNAVNRLVPVLEEYEYFRLPAWADFRLILLERDRTSPDIHCQLIHATFSGNFEYDAVSYTWGDATRESRTIWINGHPCKVTANLFTALHRLRGGTFDKYKYLWIDGLCIDQGNVQERNHQVSLMGKIYSNAQTVLVWLGEQHNDSNLAVDFISEVSSLSSRQNASDSFSPYIYRGDGKYQVSAWKAIDFLFRRSYWERTWVIQEIQLARNVHIYCGDHAFDWLAGSAFFDFVHQSRDQHLQTEPQTLPMKQRVLQSPAVQLLDSTRLFQKRAMTLKHLLYHYENSKCRESRDKIYGLLTLASDCNNGEIKPDYSKPLQGVYRDALMLESTPGGKESKLFTSPDTVHYSHFLQKILNLSFPTPDPPFRLQAREDPDCILGCSGGPLVEGMAADGQQDVSDVPIVCTMEDNEFWAYKGPKPPSTHFNHQQSLSPFRGPSILETKLSATRSFKLSNGQTVLAPTEAQIGDEVCMFSKHDAALILRKQDDGWFNLIGNAFVLVTEKKKQQRPREALRSFKYCLPDYDIFPPPTLDLGKRFYMRVSATNLQWLSRT